LPGDVEVERVDGTRRFEARLDGETVGYMSYERSAEGVLELTHTVVAPSARGQGIGEALVREALGQIRGSGERVIPSCPFVADYLKEHPEDRELVAAAS
jgi:predicted GNAT family acetyltransferase